MTNMPSLMFAMLLFGCGRVEYDPPVITEVAWCSCLAFADGETRCVALTDPEQLNEPWWDNVTAVVAEHPLAADGTCSL